MVMNTLVESVKNTNKETQVINYVQMGVISDH